MQYGTQKPLSHITTREHSSNLHKEWHNKPNAWKWNAFDFGLIIHVIKENPKWTLPVQVIISKIKESHFHYLNRDSCLLPTSPWLKQKQKHFIKLYSLWICCHWTLYIIIVTLFLRKHVRWWWSCLVVIFFITRTKVWLILYISVTYNIILSECTYATTNFGLVTQSSGEYKVTYCITLT